MSSSTTDCVQYTIILTIVTISSGGQNAYLGVLIDVSVSLDFPKVDRLVDNYIRAIKSNIPAMTIQWVLQNSTTLSDVSQAVFDLLKEDIRAIVTVMRCSQRRTVASITEAFRIPHLSVNLDPCPAIDLVEFSLHLESDYSPVSGVLVEVIRATRSNRIQLRFSKDFGNSARQHLLTELSRAQIYFVLGNLSQEKNFQMLSTFRTILVTLEYVDSQYSHAEHRLTKIVLTHGTYLSKATHLLTDDDNSSILLIHAKPFRGAGLLHFRNDESVTFVESRVAQALLMAYQILRNTANVSVRMNMSTRCSRDQDRSYFSDNGFFEMICATRNLSRCEQLTKSIEYGLHVIPTGSDRRLIAVGDWTVENGLSIDETSANITHKLFPGKIDHFGGITLRVAGPGNVPPYMSRHHSENNSHHGMMIDMLKDLSDKLNFRYILLEPEDGLFGALMPDGSLSGVVGMVARGEADLGIGRFNINPERAEVVDFTTPFLQDSLGILTAKPREDRGLFKLFKPFQVEIWMLILVSAFTVSVVFSLMSLVLPEQVPHGTQKSRAWKTRIEEGVLLILSSYLGQGPTVNPTSSSARCLLTFWFVFTLLTLAMYTARLAAVLTVSTHVIPINSLQDLADQEEVGIAVTKGGSTWSLLAGSNQDLYKTIAARLEVTDSVQTVLSAIYENKLCYINDHNFLRYFEERSCGGLRLARDHRISFSQAFILPKDSPYKDGISIRLQKMVETGVISVLLRQWMKISSECSTNQTAKEVNRLGLDTLGGIFIVYGTIVFMAALILLLELMKNRYEHYFHSKSNTLN